MLRLLLCCLFFLSVQAKAVLVTVDYEGVITERFGTGGGQVLSYEFGDLITGRLVIDTAFANEDTQFSPNISVHQMNGSDPIAPFVTGHVENENDQDWFADSVSVQNEFADIPKDYYWVRDSGGYEEDLGDGDYFRSGSSITVYVQSSLIDFITSDLIPQRFDLTRDEVMGIGDTQAMFGGEIKRREDKFIDGVFTSIADLYLFDLQRLTVNYEGPEQLPPSSKSVPEPSTLFLTFLSLAPIIRRSIC